VLTYGLSYYNQGRIVKIYSESLQKSQRKDKSDAPYITRRRILMIHAFGTGCQYSILRTAYLSCPNKKLIKFYLYGSLHLLYSPFFRIFADFYKFLIGSFLFQKLFLCTFLGNASIVYYKNLAGIFNLSQTVSDRNNRFSVRKLRDCLLN